MRYPLVLQQSEEDCGAACLATVAKFYGRNFSIGRIRELAGTRSRGTSLLGLSRGAESLGFQVRQVKASPQLLANLDRAPLPAIVHWKGYHWVVLYGKNRRNRYIVADPSIGLRYLSEVELLSGWTNGVMLLLSPTEEFDSGTVTGILSSLVSVGLLWLGSYLVISQRLSVGQLLAYSGMSGNFFGFLLAAIGIVDEFIRAQVILQRLGEVMDATPEDAQDAHKPWLELSATADIYCEQLQFHHSGRMDLLEDLDLVIPGGRMTALIGRSGCGKSTLAKLLSGLYQPQSGNIRYGIDDRRDLALDCLRQQVVLVPQDAHFWSRSIVDNFRFSYPDASLDRIMRACEIVGADEFIEELPDKYQTVLGEFGANLSGGQRQRLAIARALLANPAISILDESTSALDPVSEAMLLERLQQHRRGQTTVLISHRPQVIAACDWVVMLEQGQVVIQGTPEELRRREGLHRSFLIPELALMP